MEPTLKLEGSSTTVAIPTEVDASSKNKNKSKDKDESTTAKRRCVSTACIACRRRKSKCDGNLPKCAACASVYLTECEYAPHTDHRRKGVYKKDADNLKTKSSTLQNLIHAILNAEDEEDAFDIVRQMRTSDNLEELAHNIENRGRGMTMDSPDSPIYRSDSAEVPQFEAELSGKMGDLVIDGSVKFIGGTSNLIWLNESELASPMSPSSHSGAIKPQAEAILSWTTVTKDKDMILHFLNMYFCWHYAYFTTLSKELFYHDFLTGTNSQYCSPLLVNVMLALGCHFSSSPAGRADPDDSGTTGDHFFTEAKRLLHENDEFTIPNLCTVQALALMSVREAGCGRESKGWVYSGLSFRMASDLGLNVDAEPINDICKFSDEDIDARRITFWGCFLFDKCWSNYLGRQPQLLLSNVNVKKPDVFAAEDSEMWSPYTDTGIIHVHTQPARTRAVALEMFKLAEISSDLLTSFYQPQKSEKSSKQLELKKLSDIHTRLEAWKKELPIEMEAKDGQLPQVLLMHMFYQLLYIHLYRPFLRYTKATSPLPSHVSPRKFCTQAAGAISKLFRLYKRTHGLRQICNIAVYIAHSACTIHLLNLPDKNAKRDIIHGIKQLEEIGECWTCARRTLRMLFYCAEKWKIELPDEVQASVTRTKQRWGSSELSPAAMSPDPILSTTRQILAQPLSGSMDQASQEPSESRHRLQSRPQDYQSMDQVSPNHQAVSAQKDLTHENNPATTIQLSPSEANTPQGITRSRQPIQLTKAQQDAWNAHQARLGILNSRSSKTSYPDPTRNAAVLFGGVDSLIEDSQDWWFNDQSQIALGFDNWNTPTASDWSSLGNSLTLNLTPEQNTAAAPNTNAFYRNDMSTQDPFDGISSSSADGFTASHHRQHSQHSQQLPQQHAGRQTSNISMNNVGQLLPNGAVPVVQKRQNHFDDEYFFT